MFPSNRTNKDATKDYRPSRPGSYRFKKCWLSRACALAQLTKLVAPVRMRDLVSTCQNHTVGTKGSLTRPRLQNQRLQFCPWGPRPRTTSLYKFSYMKQMRVFPKQYSISFKINVRRLQVGWNTIWQTVGLSYGNSMSDLWITAIKRIGKIQVWW